MSTYPIHPIILLRVTPTANRNSYRVARLVGAVTQGSGLRPQPWAVKSQLRQSCCCLRRQTISPSPANRKPLPDQPKASPLSSQVAGTQTESTSTAFLKERELLLAVFKAFRQDSFPLRKAGMRLLLMRFALAEGWNGAQKKQPSVIVITLGCFLVPRAGVEPARIAPLVFETSASTDSAIWATLSNNSDAKVRHFSELTNFFSEKRKNACAIRG